MKREHKLEDGITGQVGLRLEDIITPPEDTDIGTLDAFREMHERLTSTHPLIAKAPGFYLTEAEIPIVFEALGRSLRQVFNEQETNLAYVFGATKLLEKLLPLAQEQAKQKSGG